MFTFDAGAQKNSNYEKKKFYLIIIRTQRQQVRQSRCFSFYYVMSKIDIVVGYKKYADEIE